MRHDQLVEFHIHLRLHEVGEELDFVIEIVMLMELVSLLALHFFQPLFVFLIFLFLFDLLFSILLLVFVLLCLEKVREHILHVLGRALSSLQIHLAQHASTTTTSSPTSFIAIVIIIIVIVVPILVFFLEMLVLILIEASLILLLLLV